MTQLTEAGKRTSAADMQHVQAAHDAVVKLGAALTDLRALIDYLRKAQLDRELLERSVRSSICKTGPKRDRRTQKAKGRILNAKTN